MLHDPRLDFFYYRLAVLVLIVALGVVAVWPSVSLWFWGLFSRTLRNHIQSTNKPKPIKTKK